MDRSVDKSSLNMIGLLSAKKEPEVGYAKDFAEKLNLPIAVYPGGKNLPEINELEKWKKIEMERLQAALPGALVIDGVRGRRGLAIVSNAFARKETAVHSAGGLLVIAPHEESKFDRHGKCKILVPFGREDTTLKGLRPAIWIAKKTGATIVLYHTTRPKRECISTSWADHMVKNATAAQKKSIELCEFAGVSHELHIASVYPRVIAEGIADAAFDFDCNLIVMAMADDVIFGSHTAQVLDYSPVPALIAT